MTAMAWAKNLLHGLEQARSSFFPCCRAVPVLSSTERAFYLIHVAPLSHEEVVT